MNYNQKIDNDCGDLIERQDFIENVEAGCFIDYDGYGHPVKDELVDESFYVYPSEIEKLPKDCTHVLWFNR